MMQIKFNFNNSTMSATAWQRARGIRRRRWRLWLAYPIMTSFFTFLTLRALRGLETPLNVATTPPQATFVSSNIFDTKYLVFRISPTADTYVFHCPTEDRRLSRAARKDASDWTNLQKSIEASSSSAGTDIKLTWSIRLQTRSSMDMFVLHQTL